MCLAHRTIRLDVAGNLNGRLLRYTQSSILRVSNALVHQVGRCQRLCLNMGEHQRFLIHSDQLIKTLIFRKENIQAGRFGILVIEQSVPHSQVEKFILPDFDFLVDLFGHDDCYLAQCFAAFARRRELAFYRKFA